jgi:Na+-translocating ferredoxin:NAD+ oxidoreductase RnfG subunit
MRARLGLQKGPRFALCLGILLVTFSITISAQVFMSEAEALKITIPGAVSFKSEERQLTPLQREGLQRNSGLNFREPNYKTSVGIGKNDSVAGYAFLMNEIGKEENITFLVGVNLKGEVGEIVILEYRESRGGEVKEKRFLRQFRGKKSSDPIQIDRDIVNYTGATLSSKAVARGVKKALLLAELFYLHNQ